MIILTLKYNTNINTDIILILYLHAMLNWFITDKASYALKMLQEIRSSHAALFCKNDVL